MIRRGNGEKPPGYTHPGTKTPDFDQDSTKPTLTFIANEIMKWEDVEFFVGDGFNHHLTVFGISFDDTTNRGTISLVDPLGGVRLMRDILGLANGFIETNDQTGGRNTVITHWFAHSGGLFSLCRFATSPKNNVVNSIIHLLIFRSVK